VAQRDDLGVPGAGDVDGAHDDVQQLHVAVTGARLLDWPRRPATRDESHRHR